MLNIFSNKLLSILLSLLYIRGSAKSKKSTINTLSTYPRSYSKFQSQSVQSLSRVRLFATRESQHARPPCHHKLPEFTQTHVHWVSDVMQPSHPLSSPSPPAPNPSQHQSLFQWVSSLHEVAKVLEFQLKHHSLQRNPRADLLQNGLVGSPCSPRHSQESSPTPQFKSISSSGAQLSSQYNSYIHTWPLEKP